jgi:hypothetical protein
MPKTLQNPSGLHVMAHLHVRSKLFLVMSASDALVSAPLFFLSMFSPARRLRFASSKTTGPAPKPRERLIAAIQASDAGRLRESINEQQVTLLIII